MELRNEIFAHVFDWLRMNQKVKDQLDLANKTEISKNTITNILNGKTKVSDKTLLKLNKGFGYIFNMDSLRGKDPYNMLIDDVNEDSAHTSPFVYCVEQEREPEQKATEPKSHAEPLSLQDGVESLLTLASQLIKENESLRRDLQASIHENKALHDQLQSSIQDMHNAVLMLLSKPYSLQQTEYMKVAEE